MLRTRVFCDVMLRSRTHSVNQTQKSTKQQRMPNPYFSVQCQIFEIIHLLQINGRFQKLPKWRTLSRLYYCDGIRGLSEGLYCYSIRGYLKNYTATVLGPTSLSTNSSLWSQDSRTWSQDMSCFICHRICWKKFVDLFRCNDTHTHTQKFLYF